MLGLVVTPTTWSRAARSARLPDTSRSRLRSSSQIETPALVRAASGSFIVAPFLLHGGEMPARAKNSARERASVAQCPEQGRGDGLGAEGPHAAQRHARVLGLKQHADAPRAQALGQAVGDLFGQPLLDLRPGREVLDQAGQLGQAEDALAGQVADVRDTGERQQVVLADGAGTGWRGPAPARRSPRRWGTWSAGAAGRRTARRRRAPSWPVSRADPPVEVDPQRGQEVGGGPLAPRAGRRRPGRSRSAAPAGR